MPVKTVGIIGDSLENIKLNNIAKEMGKLVALAGYTLVTGGRFGVMGAASKGARTIDQRPDTSRVIGILPGFDKSEANEYVDYIIPTGIGWARNQITVLASDVVVAIGGGAGTLCEMSYAWAYNKPVIAFDEVGGWSEKLSGKKIDDKRKDNII
ncbi:MAG: TIGR00725 family protein, partial [Pseudomonadota bacterium]